MGGEERKVSQKESKRKGEKLTKGRGNRSRRPITGDM